MITLYVIIPNLSTLNLLGTGHLDVDTLQNVLWTQVLLMIQ